MPPANSTKLFMNQLVNTMNIFFNKISGKQIQFQLSEQYALPKKQTKHKTIKKQSKVKTQIDPEQQKQQKKMFKQFKDHNLTDHTYLQKNKNLSDKQKVKQLRDLWKGMGEKDQNKWLSKMQKAKAKSKQTKAKPKSKPAEQKGQENQLVGVEIVKKAKD